MIEQLLSPASWGSPLGLGIFLICFGMFIFLVSRNDRHWKGDWKDDKKKK